jgi:Bacteriophage probable baseplate hub protein
MQVDFRIIANGDDVTALLADRLLSLTITDEAGMKSDAARITIDDRDYRVALPETGAELEIAIGFRETGLMDMGTFVVDEVTGEGPVDLITIHAKASDMRGGIRARRTQNWDNVTLNDIVATIAGRHGLTPAVAPALRGIFYAYIAQTAESDLHFLSRLATDIDATAKPNSGRLVVVERGQGRDAEGTEIPVVALSRTDLNEWTWKVTGRGRYGTAEATWSEMGSAVVNTVTAGSEEPVLRLRHRYPNEAEAQRAADAALSRSRRASGTIGGSLGGFYGELLAEGKIDVAGIKPELTGEWSLTRVAHVLDRNGLITSFDAERDNEEAP